MSRTSLRPAYAQPGAWLSSGHCHAVSDHSCRAGLRVKRSGGCGLVLTTRWLGGDCWVPRSDTRPCCPPQLPASSSVPSRSASPEKGGGAWHQRHQVRDKRERPARPGSRPASRPTPPGPRSCCPALWCPALCPALCPGPARPHLPTLLWLPRPPPAGLHLGAAPCGETERLSHGPATCPSGLATAGPMGQAAPSWARGFSMVRRGLRAQQGPRGHVASLWPCVHSCFLWDSVATWVSTRHSPTPAGSLRAPLTRSSEGLWALSKVVLATRHVSTGPQDARQGTVGSWVDGATAQA